MGFRRITFHFDRPDILSKYKVRLEANKEKFPGDYFFTRKTDCPSVSTLWWINFEDTCGKMWFLSSYKDHKNNGFSDKIVDEDNFVYLPWAVSQLYV